MLFPGAAFALQDRMDVLLEEMKAKLRTILAKAVEDVRTDLGFVLASNMEILQNDVGLAANGDRLGEISETLRTLKVRVEQVRRAAAE